MRVLFAIGALCAVAQAGLEHAKYSKALGASDFDSTLAQQGYRGSLIAMFAPWCGHCKSLEPAWTSLGAAFENEEGVLVAHVDADAAANKELASKYGVRGFPTLKYFPGKGAEPIDYSGGRTAEDLVSYLNSKTGSHRKVGGLLDTMAGRLPSFDDIVKKFVGAPSATRSALLESASALAATMNSSAPDSSAATYYVRVLQKLATGSADDARKYIETESARLQKLAGRKSSLAGKKLDELQLKQNILASFSSLSDSAAAAYDSAAETVGNVKDAAAGAAVSAKDAAADAVVAAKDAVVEASSSVASAAASATERVKGEL